MLTLVYSDGTTDTAFGCQNYIESWLADKAEENSNKEIADYILK